MIKRPRTAIRTISLGVGLALMFLGCASQRDAPDDDGGHQVTLEYTIDDSDVLVDVRLTPDGLNYEGTSTITRNGEQRVSFARFPVPAESQASLEEGANGERELVINGERFPVTSVRSADDTTIVDFKGVDGIDFRYTDRGESPFIVCGGACIAALVVAAACSGYVLGTIVGCWWNDGCWSYSLLLCQGSCDLTWES